MTSPSVVATVALKPWRNAIFVLFFTAGFLLSGWLSRVPEVRKILGLDPGEIGLLLLGLSLGSMTAVIVTGKVVQALGTRRTLAVGICCATAGMALAGVAVLTVPHFAVVGVCLILAGIGVGMWDVTMNISGAVVENALNAKVMAQFHAFFSFGTVGGALWGAAASALNIHVGLQLIATAIIVAAAMLYIIRYVDSGVQKAPETSETETSDAAPTQTTPFGLKDAWKEKRTLLIGVLALGMSFAEGAANDWLAVALVDGYKLSDSAAALGFGVFMTAMTVSRLVSTPLIERFGRITMLRACALSAASGLALFIVAPSIWWGVVGIVLWGLGTALGFPVGISAAADEPEKAAMRVSVVSSIGYGSFLVGPPLLGFLGDHFTVRYALIAVLAMVVISGLVTPAAKPIVRIGQPVRES